MKRRTVLLLGGTVLIWTVLVIAQAVWMHHLRSLPPIYAENERGERSEVRWETTTAAYHMPGKRLLLLAGVVTSICLAISMIADLGNTPDE